MAAADMPDFLTLYASAQPGKLAVIDDRPGAGVVAWTYGQLEAEADRHRTGPVSNTGQLTPGEAERAR